MKQQFRALFLTGLIASSFSLTYTHANDGFTSSSNEGLGSFVQGFFTALAQPFVGLRGFDDESSTYVYEESNPSSYKNGATIGFIALCAIIGKLVHNAATEKVTSL